ncbi:MAG: DUF6359 domain-containing protein [Bacteroides sp.]|nr:DUF6359 domain-containing protein [Roseburia sp.]MCM1346605.1 DUF6359 domain-containing protein [Bacteroides sp.]MCM1421151.1 DUF6359 domain-containing protein [Bacteroides sp.]
MKRGDYIFAVLLFVSAILGGCEKLVVPEYGDNNTEKTDTDKDKPGDNSGTEEDDPTVPSPVPDYGEDEDNNQSDTDKDTPKEDNNNEELEILHDGYEDSPYWVADLTTGDVGQFIIERGASISNSWIAGYIVGYINGTKLTEKSAVFAAGSKETNILIADSPLETDYTQCVPVQLSSNTSYLAARNALNLKSNPKNIGRKVKLSGCAEKYMGCAGIKNTRKYEFLE